MHIPLDYHMHSTFSEDGEASLEELCEQAVILGIPEVGFSEHWDVGPYEKNPRFLRPEPWYAEIERLRDHFAHRLTIRAGIEIAEPHLYPAETAEVLARVPFDYVLGSVHFVGEHFMFDEAYFRAHTADEIYGEYFAEVDRLVRTADIDILAHLDIPVRTGRQILGYEPERYEELIRGILRVCIERGLALDVNTAGLRKPARVLMPDRRILRWYAELGGSRVTLGSDAHRRTEVGLHLERALQTLSEAGFNSVTRYEQRQAARVPLR